MKKIYIGLLIFVGLIVTLGILGRITGAFHSYSIPTPSNEPTIKKGSTLFASNIITPKRFDFICFLVNDSLYGRQVWVFRACGMGGDVIEIRNGDLLVNNEPVDKKFTLQHFYKISQPEYEKIRHLIDVPEEEIVYRTADTVLVPLEENFFLKNKINAKRVIFTATEVYPTLYKAFSNKWSLDNFGPVTVPQDKYFVLGDNRHNAMDSRYIGFINKTDVTGTVLWK